MTVYVRWYGKVLEGELLEGTYLGMCQVRIPLDGCKPVALFSSGHVYKTAGQLQEVPKVVCLPVLGQKKHDDDIFPAVDRKQVETFKRKNWDQERGYLRTDKLNEFYQLWRTLMVPTGHVEAKGKKDPAGELQGAGKNPKRTVSDERMELCMEQRMAQRSQPRKEAVQLSLFE